MGKRIGLMFAAMVLAACGQREAASEVEASSLWTYDSLTWIFQCPNDPLPVPQPGARSLVLVDGQNQLLNRERLVGTKVNVQGRICPPAPLPRDIVFVIDVSGSMVESDPTVNGSCGRLDALNTVFAKLPAGNQFALATFDSGIEKTSDRLYDTKDALINQITTNKPADFAGMICTGLSGTTYLTGLNQAQKLLATGRVGVNKTIVFLSDGAPDDGNDAIALATTLKTTGVTVGATSIPVTIATIMLGDGDDSVLKNGMASQVPKADDPSVLIPLHVRAADANALPGLMDRMAGTVPASGIVSHGPDYNPLLNELDFVPLLKGKDFKLPPFEMSIDGKQKGYELRFGYNFVQDPTPFTIRGTLSWAD